LLTLGEILQLLVDDALVLVSGVPLIQVPRAQVLRQSHFIVSSLAAANLASVRHRFVMVNPDGRLWIELSPLRPPPLWIARASASQPSE
jgi:hypothetical protein